MQSRKVFNQASNKIGNAAILYRVVQMIDGEKWVSMSSDVKGEIYEGLLQKSAEDVKSGAGQYFTPRPLIHAMVRCVRPKPKKTIADPCCGSAGFFLACQSFISSEGGYTLDREAKEFLKNSTFYGNELVNTTYKMALMNLYLHNIGDIYGDVPVTLGDALLTDPGYRVDYVLTNPPFGKKSSITFTNEEGEQEDEDLVYNRQDFWTTSSNKQLNFVQHINTVLKASGKAAVVVPDNMPRCPKCGKMVRPDVTLYGEFLPQRAYEEATALIRFADCLIIGGTSLEVGSAAQLAHMCHGKYLVIINKGKTKMEGRADLVFHDSIGRIMNAIEV